MPTSIELGTLFAHIEYNTYLHAGASDGKVDRKSVAPEVLQGQFCLDSFVRIPRSSGGKTEAAKESEYINSTNMGLPNGWYNKQMLDAAEWCTQGVKQRPDCNLKY